MTLRWQPRLHPISQSLLVGAIGLAMTMPLASAAPSEAPPALQPLGDELPGELPPRQTLTVQKPAPARSMFEPESPTGEPVEPTPAESLGSDTLTSTPTTRYDQALTIHKVTIDGNRLIRADKIRESMRLTPGSLYSKKTLQEDLKRIYDLGYFTEKLKAIPISTKDGIVLRIEVQENAPVTGVNLEGNTILSDRELQEVFASQTGLPQNIGQLNESIEKIEQLYAEKGYILARVTDIHDDPDGTINLKINEGYVDKIHFVGNRKTKDFVIKNAIHLKEGELYNEEKLKADLKNLYASQTFSDVRRVITVSPEDPDKYNITIEMDEKKTGTISVGGGVDTATGLFGSVGYTDPNFLGRGQNVNATAAVGTGMLMRGDQVANARTYQFELGWSDPSLFETENALQAGAYGRDLASFNVPLAIERRIGSSLVWSRPLLSTKHMAFNLELKGENVNLRDAASTSTLNSYGISGDERDNMLKGGTYLMLSPTLAFDSRDDRFNPTTGWFNTVSVSGAGGLGADSYGVASANLRRYFKIKDGMTLALNAQTGQTLLGDMPEFNMFRMGGSWSVRGFQEGGIGTGGGFAMASAELRTKLPLFNKLSKKVPMLDTMQGVLFADAGTIFNESVSNKFFDRPGVGASVGVGLRVSIPGVGPVRVDYAVPIMGTENDSLLQRFNFGMGQKF